MKLNKDIQNYPFWTKTPEETSKTLNTNAQKGLSQSEAVERLQIFGENIIEKTEVTPAFFIFLNQLKSPLILMLLIACGITLFIGHLRDSIFIFSAIAVNTALGFYQEYKAGKAISELKTYLKQRARVIRAGEEHEIDATKIVPGDIIRISQGDRIPADGRLIYTNDLQVDEAILTGESLPAPKELNPTSEDSSLGDQTSMIFAGTLATQGIATAIVCRTGFSTELGKIAELVAESRKEETPLQKSIRQFSLKAGIFLGLLTIIVFVVGILLGHSRLEMFLISVAVAVSAVPEGLPIAMTVILATGVQRMAKRKGVVRKLIAAEALGSTTIILTDKTGTLTMAKMELGKILPSRDTSENDLLEMALINTNVLIENSDDEPSRWMMNGRTIETSLVRSAAIRGILINDIKNRIPIINTLPFNAANKFSASLVKQDGQHILIFFGAPDILLKHSKLPATEQKNINEQINALAESGELVLGVAIQKISAGKDFDFSKDLELKNLSFEGLITLRDPIRPSVKEAIKNVEAAGIKIVVMSGDHKGTAVSVAREVGIIVGENGVLDASELRNLSDEDLNKRLGQLSVVSRVSPLDKLKLVKAFQAAGEIVAMTGDGVNDAPSIRQADIGIAMGSGTEVTRDVADLILLDDNFETIAAAVEEGRQIMSNIRKVLVYLLSNVADGLILIGGSIIAGVALPLNALQILWVNFFTDSFPAVAFAFEKDGSGSLVRIKKTKTTLFNPLMKFLIIFIGVSTSALLLVLYLVLLKAGHPENIVRTFIFASFSTYTLFLAFPVKNLNKSIFRYSPFSNQFMLFGIGIGMILTILAVYVPFFQTIFETVSLPPIWILGVVGVGIFNILLTETGKWIFRRKQYSPKLKLNA